MSKLMKKDFKVVENCKWISLVSIVVILLGVVFMFVSGMNLGIDYTGGATIEIELGEYATKDSVKNAFEQDFTKFIEDNKFDIFGQMLTSPSDAGVTYEFRLNYVYDGKKMDNNDADWDEYRFALNGDDDDSTVNGLRGDLETHVIEFFAANSELASENAEEVVVRVYAVGPTASNTLLRTSIIAIIVAIIVMLVYIIIRFTVLSGIAAVIALIHDVLFMTALTVIFQVPVNATYIAAIITIIGYSINASIVIFDKVRECSKTVAFAYATNAELANYSVKHSFIKVFLSSLTTFIMVFALIFSVSTIREFILPIVFGLIGGLYSALCLAPSLWVLFKNSRDKAKSNKKA